MTIWKSQSGCVLANKLDIIGSDIPSPLGWTRYTLLGRGDHVWINVYAHYLLTVEILVNQEGAYTSSASNVHAYASLVNAEII